jgi:hypothetical protein
MRTSRVRTMMAASAAVAVAVPGLAAGPVAASSMDDDCSQVRRAGATPVFRGEPGYGSHLDSDSHGVGCETGTSGPSRGTGSITPGTMFSTAPRITSVWRVDRGVEIRGTFVRRLDLTGEPYPATGIDLRVGVVRAGARAASTSASAAGNTFHGWMFSPYARGATFQAKFGGDRFNGSSVSDYYFLAAAHGAPKASPDPGKACAKARKRLQKADGTRERQRKRARTVVRRNCR